MRLTNVRQFIRGGYLTATEPTQVLRGTEVLGVWTPVGEMVNTMPSITSTTSIAQAQPAGPIRVGMTQVERDKVLAKMSKGAKTDG
jgi:hypothetical protein